MICQKVLDSRRDDVWKDSVKEAEKKTADVMEELAGLSELQSMNFAYPKCMAEDENGAVWIGLSNGMITPYCGTNFDCDDKRSHVVSEDAVLYISCAKHSVIAGEMKVKKSK